MRKGKRLIAMVLAMAVAVGIVCWRPPKAKAVVIDASAAFGAAAVTAAINGTTATTLFTGMGTSAATSSMVSLMGEYAAATGVAASGSALASSIASGILISGGVLLVGVAAAALIGGFIDWMRDQEVLEAGGDSVSVFDCDFYFSDGSPFYFVPSSSRASNFDVASNSGATELFFDTLYEFPSGFSFEVKLNDDVYTLYLYNSHSYNLTTYDFPLSVKTSYFVTTTSDVVHSSSSFYCNFYSDSGSRDYASTSFSYSDIVSSYDFSLQPKPEFQTIPQEIPEGQVLKIDTGLDLSCDTQTAADAIMQTAIDGALSPTVEVAADPNADTNTDPDTGTETDPDSSTETTPDTDSSILDWLKQIWESICNIPSAIAEAIAGIFVPSADFYPTAISNLKDAFSDRMGLLTYPISVLFDFLDRLVNLSERQPILTWGNIYLPGYATPLVTAGQYNLNDAIGTSQGKQLHDIYLVIVDAVMILAFVDLCRRKYEKIIHN